ncbi:MAG: hypothetical protein ACREVJ_04050 [Gammaproteobacteria bacterium]
MDTDYMRRKEIIMVAKEAGVDSVIPVQAGIQENTLDPGVRRGDDEFEERWTGGYVFENEWQSFRTRKNRELELIAGRNAVAVKVIDIFGNDTMTLVPVSVG